MIGVLVMALASFGSAGAIYLAQKQLEEIDRVAIDDGRDVVNAGGGLRSGGGDGDAPTADGDDGGTEAGGADIALDASSENPNEPVETFPAAEPEARNILITGADNNTCLDPDSPYASAFGERAGERSDTIMMWRINPSTSQIAALSFPRDLWVDIAGRSSRNRINSAYERDDPQRLVYTIAENFGIYTDHYIQIDFCAFKKMVDAVDGVSVPFERPVRDVNTGLNVDITEPQCFEFDGDHALAYVRSRKLQTTNEEGEWISADGVSDLGRISRQQDFIRRVADEAIANAFSPSVILGLIETSEDYIVLDSNLTPNKILQFAGVIRSIDPSTISTYQIESTRQIIGGNDVQVPVIDGENMQAVLALFRGEATLDDRIEQDLDEPVTTLAPPTTVPLTAAPVGTQADPAAPPADDEVSTPAAPTTTTAPTTLPTVDAEDVVKGYVPDAAVSCA